MCEPLVWPSLLKDPGVERIQNGTLAAGIARTPRDQSSQARFHFREVEQFCLMDAGQLLSAMQRGEFTTEAALILADVMKLP